MTRAVRYGVRSRWPWLLFLLAAASGCSTMARFRPADQQVIAAREMSRLGADAMRQGRLEEAEARLAHALRKCPHDAESRRCLAQLMWTQGRRREAITQMDSAVRLSGDDPVWMIELGRMLLEEGDYNVAGECAARSKARDPTAGAAWALEGDVLQAGGDAAAAQRAYHRAMAAAGAPPATLLSLASLYERQGKHQRSLATLRRYEDSTPEQEHPADLPLRQGLALESLGRYEQAIVKFTEAEQNLGRSPDLLVHMAQCHVALGEFTEAETRIAAARQLQPDHPQLATLASAIERRGPAGP